MNDENLNESSPGIIENSNLNQQKKDNVYHAIYIPPESEPSIEGNIFIKLNTELNITFSVDK